MRRPRRSRRAFDAANGGWGGAPKFPQPMTIEFLLRRAAATGDPRPLAVARRTLDAMADGGIHDQLGGGFHRYATDAIWLVPHFEQMLYDNAQLARVYLHAWALTRRRAVPRRRAGTLDYMMRELRPTAARSPRARTPTPRASRARRSPGRARRDPRRARRRRRRCSRRLTASPTTATGRARPSCRGSCPTPTAATCRGRRGTARDAPGRDSSSGAAARPQPARDDKALAAWNGLAIAALGRCASRSADGRRRDTWPRATGAADGDRSRAAAGRWPARSLVEGRPRDRRRRPRGLRPSRRRAARAVRGDLRRALVRDGPRRSPTRSSSDSPIRPAGSSTPPTTTRRSSRARRTSRTTPCRPGGVDGGGRAPAAGGADRRGALPRRRRARAREP